MNAQEFKKGQKWALRKAEINDVLAYLSELKQGDKITIRGEAPVGWTRLPLPGPCEYVGLVPKNRKYPVIYEWNGESYCTDLQAVVLPHDAEEIADWDNE